MFLCHLESNLYSLGVIKGLMDWTLKNPFQDLDIPLNAQWKLDTHK